MCILKFQSRFCVCFCCCFVVRGIELSSLYMSDKHSATEPRPKPLIISLLSVSLQLVLWLIILYITRFINEHIHIQDKNQ